MEMAVRKKNNKRLFTVAVGLVQAYREFDSEPE